MISGWSTPILHLGKWQNLMVMTGSHLSVDTEQTFADPGNSWKEQSIRKVKLLFALRRHLEEQKLVESFPTFIAMMQCLGIEDSIKFPHRAFIYLVALTLYASL